MGGVQQPMPLDISGTQTPSDHDASNANCSQSQSSHSGNILEYALIYTYD